MYVGADADKVGQATPGPDGTRDGHFVLTLTLSKAHVVTMLQLTNQAGSYWDTAPGGAVLGVYRNGKRLNPKDEGVKDSLSGTVTYDLYAYQPMLTAPDGSQSGLFDNPAYKFVVVVSYDDGSTFTSPAAVHGAAPTTTSTTSGPPSTTGTTTTTEGSATPDTHQKIPDFWVTLSSPLITHNTLGLGMDGALTANATNQQELTVQVLERATGCEVAGTYVQLLDPKGAPFVPPGQVVHRVEQTRANGLLDIGGLVNMDPGLYHIWVYAKSTDGTIVAQGYLPLEVKDRGGAGSTFETLNGRQFKALGGGQWMEPAAHVPVHGVRMPASANSNPFAAVFAAFQQLVSGIVDSIAGKSHVAEATKAGQILSGKKGTDESKLQQVQAQNGGKGLYPVMLVTTAAPQPLDPKPAGVELIGHDGAGLIGNSGSTLIGHDGAGIISHDGGTLLTSDGAGIVAAGGGNIVAQGGGNIVAQGGGNVHGVRRTASASDNPPVGACMNGYKTVGEGKVVDVKGTPVLANNDGRLTPGTIVVAGTNEMPVNGQKS